MLAPIKVIIVDFPKYFADIFNFGVLFGFKDHLTRSKIKMWVHKCFIDPLFALKTNAISHLRQYAQWILKNAIKANSSARIQQYATGHETVAFDGNKPETHQKIYATTICWVTTIRAQMNKDFYWIGRPWKLGHWDPFKLGDMDPQDMSHITDERLET